MASIPPTYLMRLLARPIWQSLYNSRDRSARAVKAFCRLGTVYSIRCGKDATMWPAAHCSYHSYLPSAISSLHQISSTNMKLSTLLFAAYACTASAKLTWTLQKTTNPTADQKDAYTKIEAAMTRAVARYHKYSDANKTIRVAYSPGVPTAEANYNGDLRFGSNRAYMTERTAMHEISHTLGVGQTAAFDKKCKAGHWKTALPLLRSFDGSSAEISCGGGHFWPYGLNVCDISLPFTSTLRRFTDFVPLP
jgi:hypothetical protein